MKTTMVFLSFSLPSTSNISEQLFQKKFLTAASEIIWESRHDGFLFCGRLEVLKELF